MPKKVTPEDIEKEVEQVKESKGKPVCGHINKQHTGTDGKLEDLVCNLPEGHKGDHKAKHQRNIPDYEHDDKGKVKKVTYHQEEVETSWGDAAGTPASQIQEEVVPQMSLLQKDLVMQILSREPALDVKMAVAKAKMSKEWNAASG